MVIVRGRISGEESIKGHLPIALHENLEWSWGLLMRKVGQRG